MEIQMDEVSPLGSGPVPLTYFENNSKYWFFVDVLRERFSLDPSVPDSAYIRKSKQGLDLISAKDLLRGFRGLSYDRFIDIYNAVQKITGPMDQNFSIRVSEEQNEYLCGSRWHDRYLKDLAERHPNTDLSQEKPFNISDPTEFDLQKAVIGFLEDEFPEQAQTRFIPGDVRKAGIVGYRKGAPDILLCHRNNKYIGIAIELKTPKGSGSVSHEQIMFLDRLNKQGYFVLISNDILEIKNIFKWFFGKINRNALRSTIRTYCYLCPGLSSMSYKDLLKHSKKEHQHIRPQGCLSQQRIQDLPLLRNRSST